MKRILILCTHNSARSQMAEGFLRHIAGDDFEVASAGTEQTSVRPEAIEAMRKHGIDISTHTSKTLAQFVDQPWDYVITVCDDANEACPIFPGAKHRLHLSFPDPSGVIGSGRQAAFDAGAASIRAHIDAWLKRADPEAEMRDGYTVAHDDRDDELGDRERLEVEGSPE